MTSPPSDSKTQLKKSLDLAIFVSDRWVRSGTCAVCKLEAGLPNFFEPIGFSECGVPGKLLTVR